MSTKAHRTRTVFVCQACGGQTPRWLGRCPECDSWNTLVETVDAPTPAVAAATGLRSWGAATAAPTPLAKLSPQASGRRPVAMAEFNRVLGGGVVPGSVVLLGGDPGIGKCLAGSTRVLDPISGDFLPIATWADQRRPVLTLDRATNRLAAAQVTAFHDQGVRPIVEITTRLGRILRCTPNHPVLTPEGWRPVGELASGARIAGPRRLAHFGSQRMAGHEVKLLAYVLSDGSAAHSVSVTTAIAEIEADLRDVARGFGVEVRVYSKSNGHAAQFRFVRQRGQRALARRTVAEALRCVQAAKGITWAAWARAAGVDKSLLSAWRRADCVPGIPELARLARTAGVALAELAPDARDQADMRTPVARFLDAVGLRFKTARTKQVPECVFRLPREQVALFLKVLFSCDGSLYVNRHGQPGVSYTSISRRLAEDVQHLLLRLGFVARLRTKASQVDGRPYLAYELQLLGRAGVKRFIAEIGIWGRDRAKAQIAGLPESLMGSTHTDTIPTGDRFWMELRAVTVGASFATISARAGVVLHNRRHDRPLRRTTVAGLASAYPTPYLAALAEGDIYWDAIERITPAGEERVYDLTVPAGANFVANDLIVHNSTLLMVVSADLARQGPVLYVSGEESPEQLKMRADRLGLAGDQLYVLGETRLEEILAQAEALKPILVVVDSIQTTAVDGIASPAGSIAQVRECAMALLRFAKASRIPVFLVGHVTKEGAIAGPQVLAHIVDAVLYLEGERFHSYRVLRGVKNRFGSTDEIGVFEMRDDGMAEVPNPSEVFLAERAQNADGSTIAVTLEGTRPLLVEVQALTATSSLGLPRRTANGIDNNRLQLLTAVLQKRVGLPLGNQDIFVNVVGGLRVTEPAIDLAVATAIASSFRDLPAPVDLAIVGEIGLNGELRRVSQVERRLAEAAKLGFRRCLVPRSVTGTRAASQLGVELIGASTLNEALRAIWPDAPSRRSAPAES